MTKDDFIADVLSRVKQELENKKRLNYKLKADTENGNVYWIIANNDYLFSILFRRSQDCWTVYFSNNSDVFGEGIGIEIDENNAYIDSKMIYTMINPREKIKQVYEDLSQPIKMALNVMLK